MTILGFFAKKDFDTGIDETSPRISVACKRARIVGPKNLRLHWGTEKAIALHADRKVVRLGSRAVFFRRGLCGRFGLGPG